jgi:DNA-nicking Smr family endonuclease
MSAEDSHQLPIDGTLDLHTFRPGDTKDVVMAYIEACIEDQVYSIRIIHGKGKGVQRDIVKHILRAHPQVASFKTDTGAGSWGATMVNLKHPNML